MAHKPKKLKKAGAKPKSAPSAVAPPLFAPTPFNVAVRRLVKQREELEKRQKLTRVLRDESAAIRHQAAMDALRGMRTQGFTPGMTLI